MRAERSRGRHRSPFRLRGEGKRYAPGAKPLGLHERGRLLARFARDFLTLASGGRFARLRVHSVRHHEAFLRCPAHCRVGSEPAHFAPFLGCNGVFALR
jgi:hypothetical protein